MDLKPLDSSNFTQKALKRTQKPRKAMIIKKIVLHNIRSYVDEEINFNQGKTLISGDIGSGKSTILVSIEFALFGLLKGDISGNMLLRHGTTFGFIELVILIEDKEIIIHRSLKKSQKGIEQDSGFIVINGKKTDMTPTEIKANVLALLGYPAELIAKSKSLLFRYTIYTAQEEMRQILLGDKNERLNIIRRIFGIDKYKRVRENSDIYLRHLREQQKELNGQVVDLNDKKLRLGLFESELNSIKQSILAHEQVLACAKSGVEKSKQAVLALEESKTRLSELRSSFGLCTMSLTHLNSQKSRLLEESKQLNEKISLLKSQLDVTTSKEIYSSKEEILKHASELIFLENQKVSIISSTAGLDAKQKMSLDIIQKMRTLNNCPLCLQKVDLQHKDAIISCEDAKILSAKTQISSTIVLQNEIAAKIAQKKEIIDALKLKEKSSEILMLKQQNLIDYTKQASLVNTSLQNIEPQFISESQKKVSLEQELAKFLSIEENYFAAKKALESALLNEKTHEISHNILKEKIANIEKNKILLEAEIKQKQALLAKSDSLKKVSNWIEALFCPLVESIEKQVLARVYGEFNELFIQWFDLLVEDSLFTARLDDSFAPILEQNGFDTLTENLSGGEKTACALAYRLALNKVINDIMTLVQTKDLLILDEPTDGFSDAQLDKVGEVFDNLGLKQVIIVSHERKIENFVDRIIKVSKQGHISSIVQ